MEICYLSKSFYEKYGSLKEILNKENRPYAVCIIECFENKFAIPFRSHINKNNKDCFITDTKTNAGLDFQKSVVIKNENYIDKTKRPEIRNVDYQAIHFKDFEIQKKFQEYLLFYKKEILRHRKNPKIILSARIKFSSLQYFHSELKI